MMSNFAIKNDGSPGNNYCQSLCRLTDDYFHPACDDLRRALGSLYPAQPNPPDVEAVTNPPILEPPRGAAAAQGVDHRDNDGQTALHGEAALNRCKDKSVVNLVDESG